MRRGGTVSPVVNRLRVRNDVRGLCQWPVDPARRRKIPLPRRAKTLASLSPENIRGKTKTIHENL
jgi:hypothetical protein